MSGLDTRGFVDGALRGFDVMERHYDRQDRKEYREQSLRQAEADRRENQRRYDRQQIRLRDLDERNEQRYQDGLARQKELDAQNKELRGAQIAASNASRKHSEYQITQAKRTDYLANNMPMIQSKVDHWRETGEVEPIFDHEYVKGSKYDVRQYTPEVMKSYRNLEVNVPKLFAREISPDALADDLDVIYRKNLDSVVGQKDASGKTIAKTKLAKVNQVTDIDPNREGDQPGLVLGMEVFYEDGSSGGIRPVTEGRSTNPDDPVMVIPLETAMQDLTGQLKLARQVAMSPYYDQLFTTDEQRKAMRQAEKDYRKDIMELQLGINKSVEKGDITGVFQDSCHYLPNS